MLKKAEWEREPNLPAHWCMAGCITGPNGFDYVYAHRKLPCFKIERMGKNTKGIGTDWRAFCDNALLCETRFKRASQAAAYLDDLIQAVVPSILAYSKATISCGDYDHKM